MFVVTGVTGQVGRAVANHLVEAGMPVRVLVRSEEKGASWRARGCEVAIGDMLDSPSMTMAFRGATGVFIVIPPIFDPSDGFPEARAIYKTLTTALQHARPAKAVFLSTVGAQASRPNLLNQLGLMENTFSQLDLPVAFLRAAWFMENFAYDVDGATKDAAINSFLQPLDRQIPMVATDDIGKVGASLLRDDWTGKRVVELQGPEPVSPLDVANAFGAVLGKPVQAAVVPREAWEAIFRSVGMENPLPRMLMLDGFNEGWIAFEGGLVEQREGTTDIASVIRTLISRNQT